MPNRPNRYRQLERYMTYTLAALTALFLFYLLFSGLGITWLKVLTAIVAILGSGLCLAYLYLTRELLRPRSLWMTVWAGAIVLCTLVSLIAHYPGPAPKPAPETTALLNILL